MKRKVEDFIVDDIYKIREQISFPDFQREPNIWTEQDKRLLIDSILQDIDIPKLYFNVVEGEEYEVIDGQQRLWAIWEFIDNVYAYKTDSKDERLRKLEGKKFKDLPSDFQKEILSYKLQITLIFKASEDYLRKLFLRLQLGKLLITGEKLHASVGLLKDFIFKKMVKHLFIQALKIPERRFAKQTLCAQICINSFSKENIDDFSRTRYEDLKYFFETYAHLEGKELNDFEKRCTHITNVLDILNNYFKENACKLKNRSFILSAYLYVEGMTKTHSKQALSVVMPKFVEFTLLLLNRLKEEGQAGFSRKNKELYRLGSFLSNAPGEKYQIERRHLKLKELFEYYQRYGKIKDD